MSGAFLQQPAVHLRPLDWVSRMLGLIAGGAEQLDIGDPVRSAADNRHDVVLVPAGLDRLAAPGMSASELLPIGQRQDLCLGMFALSASLALSAVALVLAQFVTVPLGPIGVVGGEAFLVGFAMFAAALAYLFAISLRVGYDACNHSRTVAQVRGSFRGLYLFRLFQANLGSAQAVTFQALFAADKSLRKVALETGLLEVPSHVERTSVSTRNDEWGIVVRSHRLCLQHIRWLGPARCFQHFAGLLPFYFPQPADCNVSVSAGAWPCLAN